MWHPQPVPPSQLSEALNDQFDADLNPANQYFFDQIVRAAMTDDAMLRAAALNPVGKLELVFKGLLQNLFTDPTDQHEGSLSAS